MTDPSRDAEAEAFDGILRALVAGDFERAAARIDEMLDQLPDDAPAVTRSRAYRVAATAHRLVGDHDVAVEHAREALRNAGDVVTHIEAELEFGDIARTLGDGDAAVEAYDRALAVASDAAVPEPIRWQIQMRRALGLLSRGDLEVAAHDLLQFAEGLEDAPMELLEQQLSPGQVALIRSLTNLAKGEHARAEYNLEVASREARAARDIPTYIAARLAMSGLAEERGDQVGAYGALAVGWATLRAGVDEGVARDAFEPAMLELHARWGEEAFERIRTEFETKAGSSPEP